MDKSSGPGSNPGIERFTWKSEVLMVLVGPFRTIT